jgi:GNAT superfamily N-acetyltransferase
VLRIAIRPEWLWDASISDAVIEDVLLLLAEGEAHVDGPAGVWRLSLARLGWTAAPESWVHFWRDISDAAMPTGVETLRGEPESMADRVATQRASFKSSTFTEDAWQRMASTGLYDAALDIVVRNDQGAAVAVATAWVAGRGKCGILEPVGTHHDFRRQGWGKVAVQGALATLRNAGASGAAVATPADNDAAVSLYRSTGFVPIESMRSMRRSAR